ncbi:MAG: alpha/beta hydrolase [Brevundimonas sp.]|uniref:alpha/beta hydrolase n=1 Tax=Brevundimonas sp. TaxID=1871086 RepID=UPI002728AC7E|nr:alpha/beta hydrolase [Brevundimonas sp.]MDO9588495.1 alpha/beta hydrolase [Brevundimonas sp.]MDP3371040.1 alpha/beta hydrolase [Brevundimonas sp.]MDZ4107978.1 alpha/beta hydrolase [Brevundimonas sp.]
MNRAAAYAANAPLMGVPGASAPPGGAGEWFRGAGGLRLRAAFWTPSALVAKKPRGTVIVSPGRTEPIEKYYEVIGNFLARGWCVLAHDWRGQGLSARLLPDRLKGHARAVEEFLDDYARLLDAYEGRAPKPWVMVGHSMGATLNLLTLEGGESRFAGALLTSPMLRIRTGKRSMWSVKLAVRWNLRHGKAGDYVLDDADDPFDHTFEKDALTTDESRYEQWRQQLYACPHLAVGGPTWGWLAFGLDAGERSLKPRALKAVGIPVAVIQAAEDDRVWKQTNKWAAKRLGRGRYVEVPGAKHEIIMEADDMRAVFLEEFDAMGAYVSPVEDLSPMAVAVAEPVGEPIEAA